MLRRGVPRDAFDDYGFHALNEFTSQLGELKTSMLKARGKEASGSVPRKAGFRKAPGLNSMSV